MWPVIHFLGAAYEFEDDRLVGFVHALQQRMLHVPLVVRENTGCLCTGGEPLKDEVAVRHGLQHGSVK